jgi:exodeoxyribonuclease-5
MKVDLSGEQQNVIMEIVGGIKKKGLPVQTLGGYAGTGKTTIVSYLLSVLENFSVCAFTGKAANVLRKKGAPATTIHSLIYKPFTESDGSVTFRITDDLACDGIIVDEASMVTEELDTDLRSFGVPILYVGDHGQLPPVGNDFNLMESPMYKLERIHRNAGTIAKFCEWVRRGNSPKGFPMHLNRGNKIRYLKRWDITPELLTQVDQTICAFNKTRIELNTKARTALGYTELLHEGEKVMCLRNNRKSGVFNGMQGTIADFFEHKKKHYLEMESNGINYENIRYDPKQFHQEKVISDYSKDGPLPFDYAYAITAHKAQGDEWDKVLVMEQICKGWDHTRWCYTAASRAKENLLWCAA